ncbi:MAG TPA: hypothetical protein VMS65_06315, partial [Polyangiaceae bacterium]|nr:hypothetical protein [Polyangiaceae bacterium]
AFSRQFDFQPAFGIAPNQPGLPPSTTILGVGFAVIGAVLLLFALLAGLTKERLVLQQNVTWDAAVQPASASSEAVSAGPVVWFSEPFDLSSRSNLELRFWTSVKNSWQWVAADVVEVTQGNFDTVEKDIEYYFGTAGGESWSEGSQNATVLLGPRPAGRYVLRLETAVPPGAAVGSVVVHLVEDVVPLRLLVYALLVLVIPLTAVAVYAHYTEQRRWENSNLLSSQLFSESDDE